jgi:outer membrane receptor protein involved in Fe transport
MMSRLLILILGVFVAPAMTYASIYGILTGKVTDKDGNPVPGASIRVEGTTRGAYAKADGSYTIANITAGTYNVRATGVGLKESIQRVTINPDQTLTLNFKLQPDAIQAKGDVIVTAARNVDPTQVGTNIDIGEAQLQNVARESVQSVVLLSAGVLQSGSGFVVRGSRPNETQVQVDGLDVGDQFSGGLGGNFSEFPMVSNFATEQVQVLTGSFGSEYGKAMGGIVNTVVKTGKTDRYEGLLRYRTDFGALNGTAGSGPGEGLKYEEAGLNSMEANFGGPIPFLDGSTFFIAGRYDQSEFRDNGFAVIDPIGNNLGQMPDNGLWIRNLTGRLTFSITNDIRLSLGGMFGLTNRERSGWGWLYANDKSTVGSYNGIEERRAKQAAVEQLVANAFGQIGHNISESMFYEFRVSTNSNELITARRKSFDDPGLFSGFDFIEPTDNYDVLGTGLRQGFKDFIIDEYTPLGEDSLGRLRKNPLTGYIEGGSVFSYGNPYGIQRVNFFYQTGNERVLEFRKSNYLQADANFTAIFNTSEDFNHTIKTGFETRFYTLRRHNNTLPWDGNPFFDIYGEENIYAENAEVRNRTSDPYTPITGAIYVTDQIRYKGIIMSPGLRFDFTDPSAQYRLPSQFFTPITADTGFASSSVKMQISPRLYIAYPISENASLNISYGVYFQMPQMNELYDNFNTNILRGNQILGNPQLEAQRTNAYEVGYELQVTDNLFFSTKAFYKDMYNQTGLRYVPALPTPYSEYAVAEYGNSRGLEFTLTRPISDHIGFNLNYTLSSTRGTASTATSNYQSVILAGADPITGEKTFPLTEYYNDFDRRHRVNAIVDFNWGSDEGPSIGGIHFLENTNINFTNVFQTGRPYTRRDRSGVQTSDFNSERLPSTFFVDMRLQRAIPLADFFGESIGNTTVELFVDVTNLLNNTQAVAYYERTGNPDDDADQLDLQRGDFSDQTIWYRDGVNASPFYNQVLDFNNDAQVDRGERYLGYERFIQDSQARRVNYAVPRQIFGGIMIRF